MAKNQNLIDSMVSIFSPAAGLKRARARAALNLVGRSYDGAKTGRRTAGWSTGGTSANAEIAPAISLLRNRSRDLVRNNPYAAKAINSLVSNAIGTGITATLSDGQDLWARWVTECDADGQLDFYGLQMLAARTVRESGECLIRLRYRLSSDGLSVPLQIQVLEPDYLDNVKYESLPNGGWIQHGIEFDAIGRRAAYWLYKQHPGASTPLVNGLLSYRVPATDVLHIYEKTRPGQSRGVPVLAPSMLKMRDLDDYEEAELVRKGIEACFAAFVTTDDESLLLGQEGQSETAPQRRIENLAAGQINYIRNSEGVTFGQPAPTNGYDAYIRTQLHAIAAGAGITYEQLTGDLSQVNYSSIRAGTLEFRRMVEQWQWLTFIPMMCGPVMRAWLDTAVLAGKIKKADVKINWTTTRFDWVDPVKDVTGELMEIAAGLKPWSEAVRGRGYDPMSNIAEIAKEQEAFKKAGIDIQIGKLLTLGQAAVEEEKATAKNETAAAKRDADDEVSREDRLQFNRALEAMNKLSTREVPAPIIHNNINMPQIDVRAGDTNVNMPEGCIKLDAHITTPEIRAGDVNVNVEPAQINLPQPADIVETIERNADNEITRIVRQSV